MKIDDIKDPQIRALAWKYRKANNKEEFNEDTVFRGFDWEETREGLIFWANVYNENHVKITEKMKADHPEIFLKEEEKMKKTHTLENGNVLEVGKKYRGTDWDDDVSIIFTEILYFGNKKALLRDNNGEEYECCLKYLEDLIPYEEQEEKVKLTKFYCSAFDDKFYDDEFIIIFLSSKERAKDLGYKHVYTEKEFLEKFDVIL